ncbi:hypothetical protein O9G_000179 [Rozella allomycis CSF55]|uniref:E3 ubiquitin-protein ligase listerin n=1 Tax=Rozella allomycis (strain CSF55) TaxID=988480 RepID=A0A075ANY7_ROZAC|nr:hypothetical protein O9G_000179 [Rozella allomycis CSF55]|eukprot:EPZ31700.1 hypothetical protein O9G_000179 [Rozella allomycis CSF55]
MIETVDNVGEFAGVFVKPYVKLCVDGAKSVREGVNRVVGEILKRDKKALAPVLREYMVRGFVRGLIRLCRCKVFRRSAFGEDKRRMVIEYCLESVLKYVEGCVVQTKRGDLKDSCADYEDVEFKFARIVGSGLMMVGYLVENGYVEDVNEGMMDVEIWNNILNKENNVFLRQSGFKLIKIMLSKGMKLNLEIQKNILMNAFEEEESLLVESLWECILLMSERNIEIWEKNVPKKPLLNRFYGYLENGCKRQGNLVYPFILPLLNLIGEKINVKLFVNAIWKGIRSEYLEFSLIFLVVKTFVENLNYLIKNSIREKDWLEKEAILIPFEDWLFSNDSLIGNDQVKFILENLQKEQIELILNNLNEKVKNQNEIRKFCFILENVKEIVNVEENIEKIIKIKDLRILLPFYSKFPKYLNEQVLEIEIGDLNEKELEDLILIYQERKEENNKVINALKVLFSLNQKLAVKFICKNPKSFSEIFKPKFEDLKLICKEENLHEMFLDNLNQDWVSTLNELILNSNPNLYYRLIKKILDKEIEDPKFEEHENYMFQIYFSLILVDNLILKNISNPEKFIKYIFENYKIDPNEISLKLFKLILNKKTLKEQEDLLLNILEISESIYKIHQPQLDPFILVSEFEIKNYSSIGKLVIYFLKESFSFSIENALKFRSNLFLYARDVEPELFNEISLLDSLIEEKLSKNDKISLRDPLAILSSFSFVNFLECFEFEKDSTPFILQKLILNKQNEISEIDLARREIIFAKFNLQFQKLLKFKPFDYSGYLEKFEIQKFDKINLMLSSLADESNLSVDDFFSLSCLELKHLALKSVLKKPFNDSIFRFCFSEISNSNHFNLFNLLYSIYLEKYSNEVKESIEIKDLNKIDLDLNFSDLIVDSEYFEKAMIGYLLVKNTTNITDWITIENEKDLTIDPLLFKIFTNKVIYTLSIYS